jgi:hypothetical protein
MTDAWSARDVSQQKEVGRFGIGVTRGLFGVAQKG